MFKYALEQNSIEEIIGAIANKNGIDVIMVPGDGANVISDEIQGYLSRIVDFEDQIVAFIAKIEPIIQKSRDGFDRLDGLIPDFVVKDLARDGVMMRFLKGLIKRALSILLIIHETLQEIINFHDEILTFFENILRFLMDLREFITNLSQMSDMKPIFASDYSGNCK